MFGAFTVPVQQRAPRHHNRDFGIGSEFGRDILFKEFGVE